MLTAVVVLVEPAYGTKAGGMFLTGTASYLPVLCANLMVMPFSGRVHTELGGGTALREESTWRISVPRGAQVT